MLLWQPILIALAWFIVVLRWDILDDFQKWQNNIPINHAKEWRIRGLYMIPSFILFILPQINWWQPVIVFFMIGSIWWEFFDGFYNKLRNKPWRFNGSVDPDDSILDKFLYKIGDTWEAVLKWGLILVSVALYVINLIGL
jgi:hypothetical protein